jgi:triosephosphate isomerase
MAESRAGPFIAGNWKMNGLAADLAEVAVLAGELAKQSARARVALCPPATLIGRMTEALKGSAIEVGGQNCSAEPSGAFTGDISAAMLVDAGATIVILGHSERRAGYGETDAAVQARALAAMAAGLEPIVCVGETLEQRKAGQAVAVVSRQVAGSISAEMAGKPFAVAYEPVWAIGTGLVPTLAEIAEIHAAVAAALTSVVGEAAARTPILYGGSVKASNAAEILKTPRVGGALVGGASLKASDFLGIIRAV